MNYLRQANPSDISSYYNDMFGKQIETEGLLNVRGIVFYQFLFLLRIGVYEINYAAIQTNGLW